MRAAALIPLLVPLLAGAAGAAELPSLLAHPPRLPGHPWAAADVGVAVTLRAGATPAHLAGTGFAPAILPSGEVVRIGRIVTGHIGRAQLPLLAASPAVERLEHSIPAVRISPLDRTAKLVGAPAVWSPPPSHRHAGTIGEGVVVADHEGGWDLFHPDFFRPDGGAPAWSDANGSGRADVGDLVDLDGDGAPEAPLSLLQGYTNDEYTGQPDHADPGFQPDLDWLFVDVDGDHSRGFGAAYGDAAPAFGEPIFVGEDLDGDGAIGLGERLLRLGSSKIRAMHLRNGRAQRTYRRGIDLSAAPVRDASHGTGAIGIVIGGWPGLRRYTGVAPGVDLLLISSDDPVAGLAAATELGARVDYYEWDSPLELHDGSSATEEALSQATRDGFVQVTAAGNLAGSDHVFEVLEPAVGAQVRARISIDGYGHYAYGSAYANLTWTGPPDAVDVALVASSGATLALEGDYGEATLDGVDVQAWRELSPRGNTRVLIVMAPAAGAALPEETFELLMTPRASVTRLRGLLWDDQSGWGKGVSFLDHVTDAGTALMPSTADDVIAVAAYGGNHDFSNWGWGRPGERRSYSGMGPRLDGVAVVDLGGPDDPYAPRWEPDSPHGAYGAFGGTSGALPHVTGVVALTLAARPDLDPREVPALLTATARKDRFTGEARSEVLGHGKVDAFAAIFGAPIPAAGAPPTISVADVVGALGHEVTLFAEVTDPDGDAALVRWDVGLDGLIDAELPPGEPLRFTPSMLGSVSVLARVFDAGGRSAATLANLRVWESCDTSGCADGCCGADGFCTACGGGGAGGAGGTGSGGSAAGGAGGAGAGGLAEGGSGGADAGGGDAAPEGCGCGAGGAAGGPGLVLGLVALGWRRRRAATAASVRGIRAP